MKLCPWCKPVVCYAFALLVPCCYCSSPLVLVFFTIAVSLEKQRILPWGEASIQWLCVESITLTSLPLQKPKYNREKKKSFPQDWVVISSDSFYKYYLSVAVLFLHRECGYQTWIYRCGDLINGFVTGTRQVITICWLYERKWKLHLHHKLHISWFQSWWLINLNVNLY